MTAAPKTFGRLTYDAENRMWGVTCQPHAMIRFKAVFPRANKAQMGTVTLKDSPKTCTELLWFCSLLPLEMEPGTMRQLRRGRKKDLATMRSAYETLTGALVPRQFELGQTPRKYQAVGTELALRRRALLLTDEMGLGKTLQAISLFTQKQELPALIVVKVGIIAQWRRELQKCLPGIRVHTIPGTRVEPLPPADIYLTSYSRLAGWAETLAQFIKCIVFDEAHELRHRDTGKYNGALHLARAVEAYGGIRVAMTGTPVYNYGNEMFSILDLLEGGCLGDYHEFVREWCESWGKHVKVREPKALGSYLLDQGLMLRRTRHDVGIELPPRTRIVETIETDDQVLMKDKAGAIELAKLILTSPSFTTQGQASREFSMRMRQVTGIAKAPAVAAYARIFLESGEPVIIFAWHREVYTVLLHELREFQPVMFTGSETTEKQKERSLEAFKTGETKCILISLRSTEGLDGLQDVCSTVIHAELDWTPQIHEQGTMRVDRPGQKKPTFEIFLVSEDGSDPTIARVNGVKREQSDGILNPLGQATVVNADSARVKSLARDFLKRHGVVVKEVEEAQLAEAV